MFAGAVAEELDTRITIQVIENGVVFEEDVIGREDGGGVDNRRKLICITFTVSAVLLLQKTQRCRKSITHWLCYSFVLSCEASIEKYHKTKKGRHECHKKYK